MLSRWLRHKYVSFVLLNLVVAVAYFVTAKLGLSLAGSIKQVTLVWPPTGIALASVLLLGPRVLPAITIAAFIANLTTQETPMLAASIALGNTLEAGFGAYLLSRLGFDTSLRTAKSVFALIIIGAISAPLISATIGTTSIIYHGIGNWSDFYNIWITWWLGDMMGVMLFAPLILVWSHSPRFKFNPKLIFESVAIIFLLITTSLLIFYPRSSMLPFNYPLEYLIFPIIIWSSFRFQQLGTTFSTLLITSIAIITMINGRGPFLIHNNLQLSLFHLQFFTFVLSLTSMVLSSVLEEKSHAQLGLEYEEQKFRSLIENSTDVFTLIDNQANVFYTSPSIRKVIGFSPEEFQGTNIFQYIFEEDRAHLMDLFKNIIKYPGKTISSEYRTLTKDGSVKWMEGTGTNLLEEPGVRGIAICYRDIDERKRLDLVKTQFVTLAAHQLRTPLTTMKWYTEAMSKLVKGKAKLEQYTNAIYISIIKMNDLASLMLDVSRAELGTFESKEEQVVMSKEIDSVLSELGPIIKSKELIVRSEFDKDLPDILANPRLLHIIFQNLIGNAVHYTNPKGLIEVSIDIKDKNLLIEVQDNGIGIPANAQNKVFTKLFRAENGKRIMPDGTGLGLYLVKSLVEKVKGEIWFNSTEGEGSTFYVTLPIKLIKRRPHGNK